MTDIGATLQRLQRDGLYRELRDVESAPGPRVTVDGQKVLLLCSNDYLGLASDSTVRVAAAKAAERWGAGAGASRLVAGNMTIHGELEQALAEFKGYEACVLFGSGFLANTGVIPALAQRGDVVLSDALNHASIIDACRQSRADTIVYDHCDLGSLAAGLRRAGGRDAVIVTDGVFSMDGDLAPLEGIVELAQHHRARVVVDEAHATGVIGPRRQRSSVRARPRARRRRRRRHAEQGARQLRSICLLQPQHGRVSCQPSQDADLLDRFAARFRRRRAGGAPNHPRPARDHRAPPPQCATPKRRTRRRRFRRSRRGDPDHPADRRRRARCHCPVRSGTPGRGVRPGDPPTHRARRHVATTRRPNRHPHRRRPSSRGCHARQRTRTRPRDGASCILIQLASDHRARGDRMALTMSAARPRHRSPGTDPSPADLSPLPPQGAAGASSRGPSRRVGRASEGLEGILGLSASATADCH